MTKVHFGHLTEKHLKALSLKSSFFGPRSTNRMLTNGQFCDIRIRSLDGLYLVREFLNLLPLDLKDLLNLLYQLELSILNLGLFAFVS